MRIPTSGKLATTSILACALAIGLPSATASAAVTYGAAAQAVSPQAPNPLVGVPLYLDRVWTPQFRQYREYLRRGDQRKAQLMARVAFQPQFRYFGKETDRDSGGTAGALRKYLDRAQGESPGSVPQIAVMRHEGEACNSRYTGGGVAEDERTKRWYDAFARGVGDSRVILAFEPDSLGTLHCLAPSRRAARIAMLRYGVDVLSKLPNATIYLEGGASDWHPAARVAKQLRQIGIAKVRGFMLNATHYDWTASNIRYGRDVSRRTGGKHFVISTSHSGRGPVHYLRQIGKQRRRINARCHPLQRGLGPVPSTNTADPLVDAYLWIARPGYSGGPCNGGPLPVGSWFPERALMLARYQTNWLRSPRGFRYGWPRGSQTIRSVAGDQYIR